ncbi:MAG: hypothetical protein UT48_C0008G0010 [Parcubacteria group bacterium GW2011_GWE2_39_37]|uniref:ABC transporter permease protein n=1 Tax=Candidatus Falkowbacteria bacterium GW2011_GWF2_39_8 TaxID=1618642 RepID=A0A0G0Q2N0_9BACT|nr:MAG: hypothetical protein UT48_C0008G0010 [Parcubacteria group bacterium GW2011_GWE2_39_37]KKR31606.1 MAG: hypothetical protein UT64_C0055G0008 [Candidatus Falkowbacteria bacterium GW2011_GWF2_39_8]
MRKYLFLIKTAWQRQLVYRATVYGYRLGNIFDVLFQVTIWTAVYKSTSVVYGYNYNEMITYVMIGWLINFMTANYGIEDVVSRNIQNGELNVYLTRPLSYLRSIITMSIGRTSIALISGVALQLLFIFIFQNHMVAQTDLSIILVIFIIVILGYFVRLLLSILFGLIAFWATDVSGLNSFFATFIRLLSGGYAPLSLLPAMLYKLSLFFPFAYIVFFPTQLYLGKLDLMDGIKGVGVELLWLVLLYVIIKIVWNKGLKKYEGVGI